jgi:hypothetical protein
MPEKIVRVQRVFATMAPVIPIACYAPHMQAHMRYHIRDLHSSLMAVPGRWHGWLLGRAGMLILQPLSLISDRGSISLSH